MQSMAENEIDLKRYIREIPDYPIPGVNFKDITSLIQDGEAFKYAIDKMSEPYLDRRIDKLVLIEARGFVFSPIAINLGCGVSLVRKPNKLPCETISASYEKEYGKDTLEMHKDTIRNGDRVLIIDDLLATGGTVGAAIELVERSGGIVEGLSFVVDLPFLGGSQNLSKSYRVDSLVSYGSE